MPALPQSIDQTDVLYSNGCNIDLGNTALQTSQIFNRNSGRDGVLTSLRLLQLPSRLKDTRQHFRRDIVGADSQQKAIKQRGQSFIFRQTVAGADCQHESQTSSLSASPKDLFIQRHQETVQNRAVRIEKFVEKNDIGFRQHTIRVRQQFAFAQPANVERSKQFGRLCESREQIVKHAAIHPRRERSDKSALGGTRWSQQEQIFTGDKTNAQQVDDFVFANVFALESVKQP